MHANTTSSIAVDYEIEPFKYEIDSHKIGVDFWNSKKNYLKLFMESFMNLFYIMMAKKI